MSPNNFVVDRDPDILIVVVVVIIIALSQLMSQLMFVFYLSWLAMDRYHCAKQKVDLLAFFCEMCLDDVIKDENQSD
jgi:hypothetical protein